MKIKKQIIWYSHATHLLIRKSVFMNIFKIQWYPLNNILKCSSHKNKVLPLMYFIFRFESYQILCGARIEILI